jgi:CubicO group peptidase (beta-lactamase class C family)
VKAFANWARVNSMLYGARNTYGDLLFFRRKHMTSANKLRLAKMPVLFALVCGLSGCYGIYYKDKILDRDTILKNIPRLEKYIQGGMTSNNVEKVSIAIVKVNEIIYAKAFNAFEDELFQAASISKAVVSYAALKLVEEGKLDLDTPLSNYAPIGYFSDGSQGNSITLRMILNHTSGMGTDTKGVDRSIYSEPGKEFHYSGAAFEYLRNVMQDITRTPFDTYMGQNILAPLGMVRSKYSIITNGKKWVSAAGGLVTTPTELAYFFIELLNPKHIRSETAREMLSDSIRIDGNNSWGLGVGIQHGNGENLIWHSGNNGRIWWSFACFSVPDQTGIIVMTKGRNGYKIYQEIAHYAIGGSFYGTIDVITRSAANKVK